MSREELDSYINCLNTGPVDYFSHADACATVQTQIEESAKKGFLSRKQHTEIVSIISTVDEGVKVITNWPSPNTVITIPSKDIVNRNMLMQKYVNCVLTVFKRGWFHNATYEYSLTPVGPLSLDSEKIDSIIENTLKEDPWKF